MYQQANEIRPSYMAWSNLCRSFGAKAYGELSPWLEAGQETLIMAGLSLAGAVIVVSGSAICALGGGRRRALS